MTEPATPTSPSSRRTSSTASCWRTSIPPAWVNPSRPARYHLVVIGAGTAGLVSAAGAAGLGARVALIERHLMGGDCLNVGCVPSKGVIRASRAWAGRARRRAERFGGPAVAADAEGDFGFAMERMRRLRAGISEIDSAEALRRARRRRLPRATGASSRRTRSRSAASACASAAP